MGRGVDVSAPGAGRSQRDERSGACPDRPARAAAGGFVPDIAAKRAAMAPEAIAFRDLPSGIAVTYRELDDRARRAARLLASRGCSAGDRIAVLCRNRVEFFELLFACGKLGAILMPLNWRMPAAELRPLVEDAAPAVLLYGNEDAAVACELGEAVPALFALDGGQSGPGDRRRPDGHGRQDAENNGGGEGDRSGESGDSGRRGENYSALRDRSAPHPGRVRWPADECWYLLHTSGTSGAPKAVIQTYGMALANYVNIRQAMSIGARDVTLNYLPLFHTAGINLVTLPTLIEGGEVRVMPDFDADRILRLFAEGALDTFFAVPAVYQQLSLHPEFETLDLSAIRSWGCGGAPMPERLLQRYLERGARVCNGMGMTETGPTVFLMDPETALEKPGSVGKPQLLSLVRVVGPDGRDVPAGEPGELWFAGPGITPGYWHNAEATAEALREGWLRSGDVGRCDEDGYYYIVGRIKDMYISGGENVYPAEVENVLAGHPDILEAAVVGRPDEKWGEVGCAFLLPRPGHRLPPEDELIRYCRERLAAYKVPKAFRAVEEFPRTAAGKIQKHLIEAR